MASHTPTAGNATLRGSSPPAPRQQPRRWPGTFGVALLTPIALTACAWLIQHQGTLVLTIGTILVLVVLVVAWVMCGAGPGAMVAASGFALTLFVGPALNDYVIKASGVEHRALIAKVERDNTRHGEEWRCTAVRSDRGKRVIYSSMSEQQGCERGLKPFQRVTVVEDPSGWLYPRLSTAVSGLSSSMVWTCIGIVTVMEASMLFGRLRQRQN